MELREGEKQLEVPCFNKKEIEEIVKGVQTPKKINLNEYLSESDTGVLASVLFQAISQDGNFGWVASFDTEKPIPIDFENDEALDVEITFVADGVPINSRFILRKVSTEFIEPLSTFEAHLIYASGTRFVNITLEISNTHKPNGELTLVCQSFSQND